ncbi:MAG: PAS domain-containing protein, partial [Nocardioides sp.]
MLAVAVAVRTGASLPQETLVRRLSRAGGVGALIVSATGLVVLFGWAFQVDILTRVSPGLVTMKVNTAASFTAIGAALFLTTSGPVRRARPVVAATLAVLVGLLAGLTLLEYATGSVLGFDNPFGLDEEVEATSTPGRMSPATAFSLALLAGTVLLISRNAVRLAQVFAAVSLTVGALAIVGYIFGVESLYQVGPFTSMAIHTATAVVVASLAALALRAGDGYVGLLTGNTAGGVIIRRLLPAAILVPLVGGGVTLLGLRHGLYDPRFAFALFSTLVAVAGAVLVWVQGTRLRHIDLRRAGAEDAFAAASDAVRARDAMAAALAGSERHARRVIDTAADGYIAMDATGRVTDWNLAATKIFGWSRDSAVGELLERLIIPPEQVPRHREGLARYRETGQGPVLGQMVELPARHQDGHRLDVDLT